MVDFFRVLPLQFGSLTRDLVALVLGAGVGLGVLGLVAVGADLPDPLTGSAPAAPDRHRPSDASSAAFRVPLSPLPARTPRSDDRRPPSRRPVDSGPADADRRSSAGPRLDVPVTPAHRRPAGGSPAAVLRSAIAVVVVLGGSALFMSGYSLGRQAADAARARRRPSEQAFQPFWDTYHTINERYAGGDVDREALIQGAIRGMIDALGDPYSAYLTSEEYRESLQGISGQFEGIGAEIATQAPDGDARAARRSGRTAASWSSRPLDGSPAEAAGLMAGDLVARGRRRRRSTA